MIKFNPNKYQDNKDNHILNQALEKISKNVDSTDKYIVDQAIDSYEPKKYMDFLYHELNHNLDQNKDKDLIKIAENILMLSRNKITLSDIYKKNTNLSIQQDKLSKLKLFNFNLKKNNIPFSDLKVKEEIKPQSDLSFIKNVKIQLEKTDEELLKEGKNLREKYPEFYKELIEYVNSNLNIEN